LTDLSPIPVSLVICLVCYKDTDIEALLPASISHHCLVLSCLGLRWNHIWHLSLPRTCPRVFWQC